jgi:predicted RNA-binding Zn ribbon-like protein
MEQPGDRAPAPGALALVQDLANTIDIEAERDVLVDVDGLAAFCAAHGMSGLRLTDRDVLASRELREALRDACQAHTGAAVPEQSLAVLRRLLARGPLVMSVDGAGGARAVPAPGLDGADALVAATAAAVVGAVADRTWPRLKACTAHECRWVYYDRSPAGRSRWCTMSICGSRAKMRAYRARSA